MLEAMDGTAGRAGAALKRPDAEAAALRFDLEPGEAALAALVAEVGPWQILPATSYKRILNSRFLN